MQEAAINGPTTGKSAQLENKLEKSQKNRNNQKTPFTLCLLDTKEQSLSCFFKLQLKMKVLRGLFIIFLGRAAFPVVRSKNMLQNVHKQGPPKMSAQKILAI